MMGKSGSDGWGRSVGAGNPDVVLTSSSLSDCLFVPAMTQISPALSSRVELDQGSLE
jgi:hypothetical protein